jgi:hypothetical protein
MIGATRLDQLDDNLAAADLALSPAEVQALDEMTAPPAQYPGWMSTYFTDKTTRDALGGG